MKRYLHILFLLTSIFTLAQEPTLDAHVSSKTVTVNEIFQLQIIANHNLEFDYPKLDGFQIGPGQTSYNSQVLVENGKMTKVENYVTTHNIKANQIGTYTIGSFSVRYNGKTYGSEPITIQVKEAPKENSTIKNHLNEHFYADYVINKTDAYVGEPIYLYKKMYSKYGMDDISEPKNGNIVGSAEIKNIGKSGTVMTKRENIGSSAYISASFDEKVIFPMKSGSIEVESYTSTISYNGFWGDVATVKALPRTIKIHPLPSGAPKNFNGGVGDFSISSKMNKKNVEVGDVVQLDVTIKGKGNIQLISEPHLELPPSFELYGDPVIEDTFDIDFQGMSGEVKYSYLLRAKKPGKAKIAGANFSYFNPKEKKYIQLKTDSIQIKINGDENIVIADSKENYKSKTPNKTSEMVGQFNSIGRNVSSENLWTSTFWFKTIPLPICIGFLLGFVIKRKDENKDENEIKSRVKKANKNALQRFNLAKAELDKNNHKGFYQEVHLAILDYLADKFVVSKANLSKIEIKRVLTENNIQSDDIQKLISILEECEMARFASIDSRGSALFYEQTCQLINQLDQKLK